MIFFDEKKGKSYKIAVPETDLEDGAESEIKISLSGEDESVGAIIKIIRTLAETEWDDLTEDEKDKIQSALNEIEEGIEIDIASNSRGFFDAIVAIVAISFTLGLPIIVIAIILYYKHRKRRSEEDHEYIETFDSKLKELMKRETNAGSN